jgi:hypothetical protein
MDSRIQQFIDLVEKHAGQPGDIMPTLGHFVFDLMNDCAPARCAYAPTLIGDGSRLRGRLVRAFGGGA